MILNPVDLLAGLNFSLLAITLPYTNYIALLCLGNYVRRSTNSENQERKFLIVIPAHNEELNISNTIAQCLKFSFSKSRYEIWVIADNCTDKTAQFARDAGANVVERFHDTDKSKGFALKFFWKKMQDENHFSKFDASVVLDADSQLSSNALTQFEADLNAGKHWIQGFYTVSNADAGWRPALMALAFNMFNGVWLKGQDTFKLGTALRGNGMCFSHAGLMRVPWSADSLAEDLEFAWILRLAGERAYFNPEIIVTSDMLVDGGAASVQQRQRWEHGRALLNDKFKSELWKSNKTLAQKILLAIDLSSPSLSVLGGLGLISAILTLAQMYLAYLIPQTEQWNIPTLGIQICASVFVFLALGFYFLTGIFCFKKPRGILSAILHIPQYALWKLVLKFKPRPQAWIRTERLEKGSKDNG